MKEVDDTPVGESESECPECDALRLVLAELIEEASKWPTITQGQKALALRVANLEGQRPPQAPTPDPEWYS